MVGCAFVQLSSVGEAAKAIKQLNGKPFLNRPIAVDWAVSKEQFSKGSKASLETKDSSNNTQLTESIADEKVSVLENDDKTISEESEGEQSEDDDNSGEDDDNSGEDAETDELEDTEEAKGDITKQK